MAIVDDGKRMWGMVTEPVETFHGMLRAHGRAALDALVPENGASALERIDGFLDILGPWSRLPIADFADHRSWASNDEWPVELSFAFSRAGVRLRLGVEELGVEGTPLANLRAGRDLLRRLAGTGEADLSGFLGVEHLFFPPGLTHPNGPFSLMHAVDVPVDGRKLLHKTYLNPGAGEAPARVTVAAALKRLGLGDAWAQVEEHWRRSGVPPWATEICLVALDLGNPAAEARVKVYVRHNDCDAETVEALSAVAHDQQPGAFENVLRNTFVTGAEGLAKSVMTALVFTPGRDRPASVTLYCPTHPNLPDDAVAAERVASLFKQCSLPTDALDRVVRTVSGPFPQKNRHISWFGYKCPSEPVITVYAGLRNPVDDEPAADGRHESHASERLFSSLL